MPQYKSYIVRCTDETKRKFNTVALDVDVMYSKIALLRNRLKAGKVAYSDSIGKILIAADFYNNDKLFVKVDWDDVLLTMRDTGDVTLEWVDGDVSHFIAWRVDY